MKILRVFPCPTSCTPDDDMVAFGFPGLFRPPAEEVHISVTFTWDKAVALEMKKEWTQHYKIVRIGGRSTLQARGGERMGDTKTTVVRVQSDDFDIYIGRKTRWWPQSKWANPFRIKRGSKDTRMDVIAKYERYVRNRPDLMAALPELRGKRLGCWCKPLPCHGDVLVKLVEELDNPSPSPGKDYICAQCAKERGGELKDSRGTTWHWNICPYCNKVQAMCATRDWKWPRTSNQSQAVTEAKE